MNKRQKSLDRRRTKIPKHTSLSAASIESIYSMMRLTMDALSLAIWKKKRILKSENCVEVNPATYYSTHWPNNDNNNPGPSAATAAGQITIDASRLNMLRKDWKRQFSNACFVRINWESFEIERGARTAIWISNHFYVNSKAYRI